MDRFAEACRTRPECRSSVAESLRPVLPRAAEDTRSGQDALELLDANDLTCAARELRTDLRGSGLASRRIGFEDTEFAMFFLRM